MRFGRRPVGLAKNSGGRNGCRYQKGTDQSGKPGPKGRAAIGGAWAYGTAAKHLPSHESKSACTRRSAPKFIQPQSERAGRTASSIDLSCHGLGVVVLCLFALVSPKFIIDSTSQE